MTYTGTDAVRHYDNALDCLLLFREDVTAEVRAVLADSPRSVLGNVFQAYLGLLGTEETDAAVARTAFAGFRRGVDLAEVTPRERLHVEAAASWLDGDLHRAGRLLGEVTTVCPQDALALAVGHQIDFFTGNAVLLRDRIGGALSAWDEADPRYGFLLGMYAFGLEEAGHYGQSEQVGLAAVERNARDVWGIHAVVHAYEMQGRFADGIRYLDERSGDWAEGNYLNVHNWWHYALYLLEAGRTDRVLEVYDAAVHHDGSAGVAMELLDAASLLWRLTLAGAGTGGRWAALADAWAARRDGAYYVFNDVHAVMAYVGADRIADAERLLLDRQAWSERTGPEVSNVAMTAEVGLPVGRAIVAYGQGRYDDVVDLLLPLRYRLHAFGGSHAQRDAVQRTLVEAAVHAGRHDVARTLLSERISLRPVCPYNWQARARLADRLGDTAGAAAGRLRAAEQMAAAGVH
ncbi:tetratricopeptide repeat protein [Streptomyces sp. SCA3-4]|uniref:tetratricopeptide repeat protein n=1 Tax=Streptomyces sichuanensis TaxID=2871810 RepID=UPI001CE35200|nr:tetratricopeptide repeat protein [Streptomyces sichuanensis]MCA6093820.1 tetratricopeptide repeat protein [Streptomyces sichuanensis]